MKYIKKLTSIFVAMVLSIVLVSCGNMPKIDSESRTLPQKD